MEEWPLTLEESLALRSKLSQEISMKSVVSCYASGIEEATTSMFTHKCKCPNKDHKQGQERTPSFFFSEVDKTFMCFGCRISGDVFDFVAFMRGHPVHVVIRSYIDNKKINVKNINIHISNRPKDDLFKIKHKLCISIRNYINSISDPGLRHKERQWADLLFKKIDDRFERLDNDNLQSAKYFCMQISVELDRHIMEQKC